MFLSVSLCTDFLVVALGIGIFICNLSPSSGMDVLPLRVKCRPLLSFRSFCPLSLFFFFLNKFIFGCVGCVWCVGLL